MPVAYSKYDAYTLFALYIMLCLCVRLNTEKHPKRDDDASCSSNLDWRRLPPDGSHEQHYEAAASSAVVRL